MDAGRAIYRLTQAYVIALFVAGLGTALWLFGPRIADSPNLAGLWFAVGGFGLLVLLMFVLVRATRR